MASVSKDRTMLFDGLIFRITPETGAQIWHWLSQSKPHMPAKRISREEIPLSALVDTVMKAYCEGMDAKAKEKVAAEIKQITGGSANYRTIQDEDVLRKIIERFGGNPS